MIILSCRYDNNYTCVVFSLSEKKNEREKSYTWMVKVNAQSVMFQQQEKCPILLSKIRQAITTRAIGPNVGLLCTSDAFSILNPRGMEFEISEIFETC